MRECFLLMRSLTCNSKPAHLLPWLTVLSYKESVGGASALQQTPLVSLATGEEEEEEERKEMMV